MLVKVFRWPSSSSSSSCFCSSSFYSSSCSSCSPTPVFQPLRIIFSCVAFFLPLLLSIGRWDRYRRRSNRIIIITIIYVSIDDRIELMGVGCVVCIGSRPLGVEFSLQFRLFFWSSSYQSIWFDQFYHQFSWPLLSYVAWFSFVKIIWMYTLIRQNELVDYWFDYC